MDGKINLQLAEYTALHREQSYLLLLDGYFNFARMLHLYYSFLFTPHLSNFSGNSVHFSKSEWTLDGLFSQLGSSLPCTHSALNGLWTWIRKCILLFWKMKKKSNWFNRIFLFLYLSNATIGKVLQSLNQHLFCITFFGCIG